MSEQLQLAVADAEQMEAVGATLVAAVAAVGGARIYLRGELGTGKTTLVRGYLRAAGHAGPVRSPTYTLIEPYSLPRGEILHLDLYRLAVAEELDYLGLRDLEQPGSTLLVEWPQQGEGRLPVPDLDLQIEYAGSERRLALLARTPKGGEVLRHWSIPEACRALD